MTAAQTVRADSHPAQTTPRAKKQSAPRFDWRDPFSLEEQLSEEEKQTRDSAAAFARKFLQPRLAEDCKSGGDAATVIKAMGDAGFLGAALPESVGGSDAGTVACGLIAREIERTDSGYRSIFSVQTALAMHAIYSFGSESLKQKWLPAMIAGDALGCFGLTEPEAGSDPAGMRTVAKKTRGGYTLSGAKMWISNSPAADVFVVWAKSEEHNGETRGFVLEKNAKGLSAPAIAEKASLRSCPTGEILMDGVFAPDESLLSAEGLKGAFECLNRARHGICWGSMGAAEFCWQAARDYGMNRRQFGKPLAQTQLFQNKLANMQTEIALGLQAALRLGRMMREGKCPPQLISLVKRNNCAKALNIARESRDMHGANGVSEAFHIIRHLVNLESVNTYEGTCDIHALILGRAQTGFSAF